MSEYSTAGGPGGAQECSRGWSEAEPPRFNGRADGDPGGVEGTQLPRSLLDPSGVEAKSLDLDRGGGGGAPPPLPLPTNPFRIRMLEPRNLTLWIADCPLRAKSFKA
jgi:hypothetical protein